MISKLIRLVVVNFVFGMLGGVIDLWVMIKLVYDVGVLVVVDYFVVVLYWLFDIREIDVDVVMVNVYVWGGLLIGVMVFCDLLVMNFFGLVLINLYVIGLVCLEIGVY